jgi:hypothetical protein
MTIYFDPIKLQNGIVLRQLQTKQDIAKETLSKVDEKSSAKIYATNKSPTFFQTQPQNQVQCILYLATVKGQQEKRKMIVVNGQAFYQSTGHNSKLEETWLPFCMVRGTKELSSFLGKDRKT